jgi:hypothetical protein
MAEYDNQQFTERILTLYAETLRQRLPRVKFMFDDDSGAVRDAISQKVYRLVREYTKSELSFSLDDYMRGDGSMDHEMLARAVADGLSVPVIDAVEDDLKPEDDDPLKRIGTGNSGCCIRRFRYRSRSEPREPTWRRKAKSGCSGRRGMTRRR